MHIKNNDWWKKEVFYQIYPASFKDDNDDGIGDLVGITNKLGYLKALGVTTIWISPIYKSPMVDNGYDISDYYKIDRRFGTMQDFDNLMLEAKQYGIKVIMDLVVNHTSDQHDWFKKAVADPTSHYRNYYIIKSGVDGNPPNNWRSNFGKGSSWTKLNENEDLYYHHVFSKHQPDLNWENPSLRNEIYQMINFWLEKGLSGFRIDAITFIKKDQDFSSITADGSDGLGKVKRKAENRPGISKFLTELNEKTFKKYNAVTIGEASGVQYDELESFIGNNGYFSMIFDFKYADIDVESGSEWFKRTKWSVKELKKKIYLSQNEIQKVGWGANFLENHDQPRSVTKYIKDANYQNEIGAKALAMMFFLLRGCPFIYQGQELGMTNIERKTIKEFNDISTYDNYERALAEGIEKKEALKLMNLRSRDNARTPFQWSNGINGGFNKGAKTWIKLSDSISQINLLSELKDSNSVWYFYQKLISLRNDSEWSEELINGKFQAINEVPDDVIAYQRGNHLKIYINLSSKQQVLPKQKFTELLLNNYSTIIDSENIKLLPYQAILVRGNYNEQK